MNWPWIPTERSIRKRVLARTGDFVHPSDPPLAPRLDPQQARDGVRQVITEMHEKGALDAGNGDVLDPWIEQLRPQWSAHQVMVDADREAVAQLVAGRYEAEAAEARALAEAKKAENQETQRLLAVFERQLVNPHEDDHGGRPERRRRPRPTVDSLEGLTRDKLWFAVSAVLLVLAALGDVVNFRVTVGAMMTDADGIEITFVTAAVTAAALGLMHVVGRTARNLREGRGGVGRVLLAVIVVAWMSLGAAAFYIRTQVTPVGSESRGSNFGSDAGADLATGDHPVLSAILLGTLFLGSGLLAYWIGFSNHHPRMRDFRSLRAQLARLRSEVAEAEKAAVEAERRYAAAKAEVERTKKRAAAGQLSVDAEIAELKELARIHVAGLVGDPAATNNLTTGRADDLPATLISTSQLDAFEMATRLESSRPSKNGHSRRGRSARG